MKSLKYLSKPIANRIRYWQNRLNESDNIEGTDKVEYAILAVVTVFTIAFLAVTVMEILTGLVNGDM